MREHILLVAQEVFLEMGYEAASMEAMASRAHTSKRSLYGYFKNKEQLFLEIMKVVRATLLDRVKAPEVYSDKPADALVQFCARYVQVFQHGECVQMFRISIAEARRFPEVAALVFEVMFVEVAIRLATYLKATYSLSQRASNEAAERLLGQLLYPQLPRSLFGLDPLQGILDDETLSPEFDVKPVRWAVACLLRTIQDGN